MIMRHWMDCDVSNDGRLREWQIFSQRQGDRFDPETGAVCFDITSYGRAVVIPGISTEPTVYEKDVNSLCVAGGEGILDLDGDEHPLRAGTSLSIPPGQHHRYTNRGSQELEFIYSRRPPASSDGDFQIHHWSDDRDRAVWGSPFQGHWYHTYRGPSCEVHIADLPPRKFSHPHNHAPELDEIWYVHRGEGWHWMGREYRAQTPGWALWLDSTELHSLMNPGDVNVEYIYATSAPLLQERRRASEKQDPLPSNPKAAAQELDERFAAMVAAYRKTGISIHDVDSEIGRIEQLIQRLG